MSAYREIGVSAVTPTRQERATVDRLLLTVEETEAALGVGAA